MFGFFAEIFSQNDETFSLKCARKCIHFVLQNVRRLYRSILRPTKTGAEEARPQLGNIINGKCVRHIRPVMAQHAGFCGAFLLQL
jgi:hypothetical protein